MVAAIAAYRAMPPDQARHIVIDEAGGPKGRDIVPERVEAPVAHVRDQDLGRQIGGDRRKARSIFGALAQISHEARARLVPVVRQAVVDPALFPQHVGQQAAAPGLREPDQELAIFGQPERLAKSADRKRRVAPHRHAGGLDRDEVADQRPFERRGPQRQIGNAGFARRPAVEAQRRGEHAYDRRVGERSERRREPARAIAIVGIQKGNHRSARGLKPDIARAARAEVCRGGDRPHARVGEGREIVRRAVGRGVIDDDQLEVGIGLCQHACDRARQQRGPVVGRDHDRYRGGTCHHAPRLQG